MYLNIYRKKWFIYLVMVIRLFTTKINTSPIMMWKKNFNQKSTQLKNNWVFFLLPRKLEKLNIAWSSKKLIKIALKKLPFVVIFSSHTLFVVYMWNSRKSQQTVEGLCIIEKIFIFCATSDITLNNNSDSVLNSLSPFTKFIPWLFIRLSLHVVLNFMKRNFRKKPLFPRTFIASSSTSFFNCLQRIY